MNEYSEIWAEFCFLLCGNINAGVSEKDFENQVVRALELLGWREFKNEIERQPKVQLGSVGILRPDLIIHHNDKKALIVIEVKRPAEDIARDNIIGQLRSYMRQMKSAFGFLIGADLRIYYDGLANPDSDPILLERIEFEKSSSEGINFIKLFNKRSFLDKEYQEYLETKIKKFNKESEVKLIIEKLLSPEIKQVIVNHLRNQLFADAGEETFSEAIEQLNITICLKSNIEIMTTPNRNQRPSRRESRIHQPMEALNFAPGDSAISTLQFENKVQTKLKQIYSVLFFMKKGYDFSSAIKQTLKLFPEVKDYSTIADKCGRGFASSTDNFISWFNTGQMLDKLAEKLSLSDHDYDIFRELLN